MTLYFHNGLFPFALAGDVRANAPCLDSHSFCYEDYRANAPSNHYSLSYAVRYVPKGIADENSADRVRLGAFVIRQPAVYLD
jgi:hypothetical protein